MSSSVLELAKEVQDLENQLSEKKGQLLSALGANSAPVAPAKAPGKKRGPKPGSKRGRPKAAKPADGKKLPTANEAVLAIVKRHKNGLVLGDIRRELEDMRKRGEFQSKAEKLTGIVSVALDKLKNNKEVKRDNETHIWSAVG